MTFVAVGAEETVMIGSSWDGIKTWATPAGLSTSLDKVLHWAEQYAQETTLLLPIDPTGGGRQALVDTLAALDWKTNATEGGWFTCTNITDDRAPLHIGIGEWLADDPLIAAPDIANNPLRQAGRLCDWWRATGHHYRYTPGVATLVAMRAHPYERQPLWTLRDRRDYSWWQPPKGAHEIRDLRWQAKGKPKQPLHRWDMRSAYLASASAAVLPYRELKPTGSEPTGAGYYRVRTPHPSRLDLLPKPDSQGCRWITSAMWDYAYERGAVLEVVDSWTAPTSLAQQGRILRGWAETWRDGINRTDPGVVRDTLKAGYSQAIGLMAVPKGSVYRPDWRHLIIDQVRVSILRRISRVHQLLDLWPQKVDVDSVWYALPASQSPDQVGEALGVGDLIGRMRYEGTSE